MQNKKILIWVSGWVDSIFLLNFLEQKFEKENLVIWHFNHNLRWKESDEDEFFVKKIAEKKWIKFFSEKAEKNLIKSEDDARKIRYQFLQKIFEKENCDFLAIAHHKNDQVETLFLQMLRWTANFSPMKEFSENFWMKIWRPILDFSKQEILDFAKKNNLKRREDSTNSENFFTRNKIRNKIFPELKKINKNFWENLIKMAKISQENFFYLEKNLFEKLKKFLDFEENFSDKNQVFQKFFEQKKFSKKFFNELDISLKKILIKKIFENKKNLKKWTTSENIFEVIQMIEKWEGKKEKHWFFLEKWVVKF